MAQAARVGQSVDSFKALSILEAQHVLQLRQMIYGKGTVSREDADLLFSLDASCKTKDPAFAALYVEALTDYFVWQTAPQGYVTPDQAKYLIAKVTEDGRIDSTTELELVLNIVNWARECPNEVTALVLDAVKQSILAKGETPLGANRPRVSIGAGDVAILRKALFAPAGDGSLLITRREAELLFTLNEAAGTGQNDPAWTDFFVHAIANHLLNPMDPPAVPTRDEAAHRERWLDERGSIGSLLGGVAAALGRGDVPARTVLSQLDPTWDKHFRREAEAEAIAAKKRIAREQVDADEARWLAARIMADGTIDENERALLGFLNTEAAAIDPSLQPLLARAGL